MVRQRVFAARLPLCDGVVPVFLEFFVGSHAVLRADVLNQSSPSGDFCALQRSCNLVGHVFIVLPLALSVLELFGPARGSATGSRILI